MHDRLSAEVLESIKHFGKVSWRDVMLGLKLVPAVFVPGGGARLNLRAWDHVIKGGLVTTGAEAVLTF